MKRKLFTMTGVGLPAAICALALALVFGFSLMGCPTDGGDPDLQQTITTLVKGKLKGGSSVSSSIRSSIRAGRSVSRALADSEVPAEPFYLDIDPNGTAPAGMKALKGKVQDGNIVIDLVGVLDETSGKFVAAGVAEDVSIEGADDIKGIGIQIEGFYKNNSLDDVQVTFKVKNASDEWAEVVVDPALDDSAEIAATDSAEVEAGLPSAWTGKYKFNYDAAGWADAIDINVGLQNFSNEEFEAPTGTDSISLGNAVKDVLADSEHVFTLIAPMAWSVVIEYDALAPLFRTALTQNGFSSNVDAALTQINKALENFANVFYCSFLEIAPGDPGVYYALSLQSVKNYQTGAEIGQYFTKFKIDIYNDGLGIGGEGGNEYLRLIPAADLSYTIGGEYTVNDWAETAAEARNGSTFSGESVSPWLLSRE